MWISLKCDSLEKNPGSEEALLQEILSLASEEGLILPLRSSQFVSVGHSSGSLNVQLDTMDQVHISIVFRGQHIYIYIYIYI